MPRVLHTSSRIASRYLAHAVFLLGRVSEDLTAAGQACPDHHHRTKFISLAIGLKQFSTPLSRIASLFERGGDR
jgi:rhamnose utilization protein RhaD (predicted bifunctional aldolase and dehydrogenase)